MTSDLESGNDAAFTHIGFGGVEGDRDQWRTSGQRLLGKDLRMVCGILAVFESMITKVNTVRQTTRRFVQFKA